MKAIIYLMLSVSIANIPVFAGSEGAYQPGNIDEGAAIDIVNTLPQIEELRETNPEARILFTVVGTPEDTGRWEIKAMTDQGTHYSNVGIFYVYPDTGRVTRMDPLTCEEAELEK